MPQVVAYEKESQQHERSNHAGDAHADKGPRLRWTQIVRTITAHPNTKTNTATMAGVFCGHWVCLTRVVCHQCGFLHNFSASVLGFLMLASEFAMCVEPFGWPTHLPTQNTQYNILSVVEHDSGASCDHLQSNTYPKLVKQSLCYVDRSFICMQEKHHDAVDLIPHLHTEPIRWVQR